MTGTADSAHRFDWLAGVATLLAILACYGTIVLIGALSADGIAAVRTSGCLRGVTLSERGGVLQ